MDTQTAIVIVTITIAAGAFLWPIVTFMLKRKTEADATMKEKVSKETFDMLERKLSEHTRGDSDKDIALREHTTELKNITKEIEEIRKNIKEMSSDLIRQYDNTKSDLKEEIQERKEAVKRIEDTIKRLDDKIEKVYNKLIEWMVGENDN